jgi:copper chaperone NosL
MKCHLAVMACTLIGLGCSAADEAQAPPAVDLTRQDSCAADGMILLDFPGPKAQFIWRDSRRTAYCETREAFATWLNPVERNRIRAFYVQDLSGLPWGSYVDRWIAAEKALFVIGSDQMGAMGISYPAFARREDADIFRRDHGGRILSLDEITPEVYEASQEEQIQKMQQMHGKHGAAL